MSTSIASDCPARNSATSRKARNGAVLGMRVTCGVHIHSRASLGSVVVYGCPPVAMRI